LDSDKGLIGSLSHILLVNDISKQDDRKGIGIEGRNVIFDHVFALLTLEIAQLLLEFPRLKEMLVNRFNDFTIEILEEGEYRIEDGS
jgi:hypothetical protein